VFLCAHDLSVGGQRFRGLTGEGSSKRISAGRPGEVEAECWGQCWDSIAEGYQTPTRREVKHSTETEVAQKVRETLNYLSSPTSAHEGLFIGEVMGLITIR
jgi:hypothetical protein